MIMGSITNSVVSSFRVGRFTCHSETNLAAIPALLVLVVPLECGVPSRHAGAQHVVNVNDADWLSRLGHDQNGHRRL